MSKYNEFEGFMQAVINEADRKCRSRHGKPLAEAFHVSLSTAQYVNEIIEKGWWVLVALVSILVLGSFGFAAALIAFCASPAGVIVLGVLGYYGYDGIKKMYKERVLPIAVKETGESYKSEFNNHKNESSYIDRMIDRASDTLLHKAIGR